MRTICWTALIVWGSMVAGAQQASVPPQPAAPGPAYTLHAATRVVLTDVVVTDRDGNPVHGLTQKDFRLFDNKKEQTLSSFEEHDAGRLEPVQVAKPKPGVFSNEFMVHLPPVVNVLLLDTSNLSMADQMYLYVELNRFLDRFPAGQPLAIFLRSGPECVALQEFTADRALLREAVKKGIPRLRNPDATDSLESNDMKTLHQMSVYLAGIPGRKNLIWFSGGSALALNPDGAIAPDGAVNVDMRPVYDELEADRISLYPIDARGLTVFGGGGLQMQHLLMSEAADATGGRAYYNSNGLDEITAKVIETDRNYYTLTYTPKDFTYDNKWHSVKVEEAGGYQLSYRRGYFADAMGTGPKPDSEATRTRLFADGSRLKVPAETSTPIVFEAKLVAGDGLAVASGSPGAPAKPPAWGKKRVMVTYTLRASSFQVRQVDGVSKIEVGAAVLLLNDNGRKLSQRADKFTVTLDMDKLQRFPEGKVRVSQEIDAGKGEQYLFLLVWDPLTARKGYLEVPIQVPLPEQTAPRDGKSVE